MKKFTKNQILNTRSICDYDSVFKILIVSRTEKTATIKTSIDGVKRVKIHIDTNNNEFIYPFGKYSMAPISRA